MRLRPLLLVLLFGALCFVVGYLMRAPAAPPASPSAAPVRATGPEIRIEPDTVELLPGRTLVLDAGPPPQVGSAAP